MIIMSSFNKVTVDVWPFHHIENNWYWMAKSIFHVHFWSNFDRRPTCVLTNDQAEESMLLTYGVFSKLMKSGQLLIVVGTRYDFNEHSDVDQKCWLKSLGLIARSVHGPEQRDSGCLMGEAAMTAPSCSQLQAGRSAPVAQRPSSQ